MSTLKMTPEHVEYMRSQINQVLQDNPHAVGRYETGKFPRADKVNDLQKRFNWDMFHAAGLTHWCCDNLYHYLNDEHISSALNKVCPRVVRRY